jgi:hypothetical protein
MPCRRNVSPSPDKQASTTASDATNSASDSLHQELLTCLEQLEALVTQRNTSGATVQLSARQSDPSPVQHNTEANNLVPTGPTVSSADTNVSYNTRTTPPTAAATTTTTTATTAHLSPPPPLLPPPHHHHHHPLSPPLFSYPFSLSLSLCPSLSLSSPLYSSLSPPLLSLDIISSLAWSLSFLYPISRSPGDSQ